MPDKKKKAFRIAMLGHKRVPSREGGVEIVVGELASRMVKKGHQVTCYNRKGRSVGGAPNEKKKLKEFDGVRLKGVWTLDKKGLAAMTSSFSAAVKAAVGRYDVVHFHAEGPCAMMWIPKLFGKRCIATIHGLDHQRAKWGKFASWYIRTGEKNAVRYADEIIVLSENVQRYFKEKYNRETIFIPNGVTRPQKEKADMIKREYDLDKDEYIFFCGRLVPEKGLRYLVEAYKQLDTNKKLVIAGGASDSSDFEKEIKAMAADDERIMFVGFVQGKVLAELYSNAYLYVLPSDLEGMPLSLLEAMSFGNCCLTSDIPECASVLETFGITFPQGDVQALSDKMKMLCQDPLIVEEYKKTAADFICDRYHWDTITERTLALYSKKKAK